jgi:hypothetical protein
LIKRLAYRAETVEMVCEALENGGQAEGWGTPQERVPLRPPVDRRRAFTKFARMRVFLEVGFIDRYSGDRLFGEGP